LLTQRLFAGLIGTSVELVEHWEQGRREPGTLARRLLDEIARDPRHSAYAGGAAVHQSRTSGASSAGAVD
jgi:transcriptional regulator with XRE-family HTH domain